MNNILTKRSLRAILIIGAVIVSFLVIMRFSQAATATLMVSPTSRDVTKGTTFDVAVRMSSDTPVTAIQANLGYSPNLEVASISYAGSAFGLEIQNIYGSGNIRLARASLTPVNGNALFATITFRATSGGTGTVNFAAGSDMASSVDDRNILGSTINGQYKITGRK